MAGAASARSATVIVDGTTASILTDFLSELTSAESVPQAFGALARAIESMGFDAIVYTAIPLTLKVSDRSAEPVFLASRGFSPGFLKHYEEAGLARHDFTIERVRAGHLDVLDWGEEHRGPHLSAEQRRVIEVARFDHAIRNALSIPTRSDEHVIAGASVISGEGADGFAALKAERVEILRTVVELFDNWVFARAERHHHFYSSLIDQFSDDEARVIKLVIGGHRLKESQELCGISPTRAGNILSSLYRKLGISNAQELAYLVGVHRLSRLL